MEPDAVSDDQSLSDLADLLTKETIEDDQQTGSEDTGSHDLQSDAHPKEDPASSDGTSQESEDGAAESEDAEAQAEPSTEPFYTVRVDGKDERVTLKEALAGYQRHQDYTRKTAEIAEARRAAEAEALQARHQRDQYAAVLKQVQEQAGTADQGYTAEQWAYLRQNDPSRYATEYIDHMQRQEHRRQLATEQLRVLQEKRQQETVQAQTFLESEREKLVKALPVLGDREKAVTEMKALREYAAKTFGYSEQEMDQAYDHRMILAIDKARRWDAHQQALTQARSKVAQAPALPPPGSRVPGNSSKQAARAALQKRFDRDGSPEDGADLLIS